MHSLLQMISSKLRSKILPLAPFPTRTPRIDQLVMVIFGIVEPSLSYEALQHEPVASGSNRRMLSSFFLKQLSELHPRVIDADRFDFLPRQLGTFVEGRSRPRDIYISRDISCSFFWLRS